MKDFNAFLMPFSFLRRWSYDELIPALLYFDRVTFLMDDIEPQYISDKYREPGTPPVRLRSPEELAGMDASELVDGLTVEQHRYYWPMRDLMREEVIVISSTDLGPMIGSEPRRQLQALLDQGAPRALEYKGYAERFHDSCTPVEQRSRGSLDKAMAVYSWIRLALSWRPGWERVTLHPEAYRSLLSSLEVFPELLQLHLAGEVDGAGGASQPEAQSYLAMRLVGTLLEEELNSYALEDDPRALSEILEVRRKHAADLQAFRATMAEATREWSLADADPRVVPGKVESYIRKVHPGFERTRRALSDRRRIPKLILRKGGAMIAVGACAGIGAALGTALAGPLGTVAGAGIGAAAPEAFKALFSALGNEVADHFRPEGTSIDKSLVYLFHATKALRF